MMPNPWKRYGFPAAGLMLILAAACQINQVECDQKCVDFWMDGPLVNDSCGLEGNLNCRVSTRIESPDSLDLAKPVVIAVHGYTASTYEWKEYRTYAEDTARGFGTVNVSMVLLGGHGRDIDAFQSSTWREWGRPILEEYHALDSLGYKNISFACASTGCALLMEYIRGGNFKAKPPKWVFMVDPIVVPSEKLLALANIVGPILGNSPNPGSDTENAHWYTNRPQETLRELYEVINRVKNDLETGFSLPKGTQARVYKSKRDGSADPVGALLIWKGMRKADGSHIEVEMEDSHLHVMTRLKGREPDPSHADSLLQTRIFSEMTFRVLANP
ncbi:MAG: esterase/lipase-like protein [Fibrobacteres bacterium]|nr:esterase/lipase-like protein [Fibrobacterota bacterium]